LFKALIDTILGRMEDPAVLLERTYVALKSELIQLRKSVAESVGREEKLELQIKSKRMKGEDTTVLESQLMQQKETTNALKKRLTDFEVDLQKAYTKQQVLIAREKANQSLKHQNDPWSILNAMENQFRTADARKPLPEKFFYWFFALLLVWLLMAIYFGIKHLF